MEQLPILPDLLVVFAVSGLVVFVLHRLKVPAVVGLLLAGLIVGPSGLGLVGETEAVSVLAEIGVVVLLFTVGLEFSLSRLVTMWRPMLTIGVPQVLACVLISFVATRWRLGAFGPAVFIGMLVAMSSTAVVMKMLTDRGELGTPQGRLAVAVLLLQDLLVTVFMLVIPLLAPGKGDGGPSMGLSLLRGLAVVGGVLLGSRYLVTPVLFHVVRTRNRELFLSVIVLMCLGTAALTAWAGLSLALGAFLAGLALSESEYAHQMFSEVSPFRDTLSSLFFVSVGMLLDVNFVVSRFPTVAMLVVAIVLLKFLAAAVPALVSGYPIRIAVILGAMLFQVGEFSFVLANRGRELGLVSDTQYQTFLATAVISMVLTPLGMMGAPALAMRLSQYRALDGLARNQLVNETESAHEWNDHVIIVGYGVGGSNLARVLRSVEIPYVILELNPDSVRRLQGLGEPILYGDCTRPDVLKHAGIEQARAMVVMISDPAATRRAIQIARQLNPRLHIVARTRFLSQIDDLEALGANEIVPEDFVSSVEIFSRVLREYQVPRNQVLDLIDRIRSDQYQALRGLRPAKLNLLQQELADHSEIETCLIREGSPAVGRTLSDLRLRSETGATVVAVRRKGQLVANPDMAFVLEPHDVALLFGDREQVDAASALLDPTMFNPTEEAVH
ncbi:MAG: cation:proton antiporter [Isosphaeraceae bacterium]